MPGSELQVLPLRINIVCPAETCPENLRRTIALLGLSFALRVSGRDAGMREPVSQDPAVGSLPRFTSAKFVVVGHHGPLSGRLLLVLRGERAEKFGIRGRGMLATL